MTIRYAHPALAGPVHYVNEDAVDAAAAALYELDHPEVSWNNGADYIADHYRARARYVLAVASRHLP